MSNLSNRERRILEAFAETLIPLPSEKITHSISAVKLVDKIDDHLGYFSKDERVSFRLILLLFDISAVFYRLRFKTFLSMEQETRERYLEAWHNTRWAPKKALWRFLDAITYTNFYSIPAVCDQIGYSPKFKTARQEPQFPHENSFISPREKDVKDECDVCVIGSGAGGAVVAKILAEVGRKVIILEEGGFFREEDFGQDVLTMTKLLYRNGGIINTFGWPAILVPVGRCVGGTTTINSGTCFRTPAKVLKKWSDEFGLSSWVPEKMERYFANIEKELNVEPAKWDVLGNNTRTFERGMKELGFSGQPISRNAPDCCGSGVCSFGCPTGAKKSMNLSYIPKALSAGARLYCHCQASRVLYDKTHVKTVIARFRDPYTRERMSTLEVKAKVVVFACGAFHTPVLLMRSHVPNPSGQIGHNLSLHPAAKVMGVFGEEIKGWNEIPQGYFVDALHDEGIMFEGIFLPPAYTASTILHTGVRHRELMEGYNNIATFGLMVSDESRGRILRLPGNRPLTIYNLQKKDVLRFKKGISIIAEAFFKAGAESVLLPLHTVPELFRKDGTKKIAERKIKAKDLDLQAFHPLGTCRMGADPDHAVCDQYGRFYGLDNLFLADGSIFPTSLGVNPMITIMAAAAKIAGYIDREVL